MKKSLFILALSIQIAQWAAGQNPEAKRTNIWYFGNGAGLDFSSGSPVPITDGALHSYEGGGSICDLDGNLLFYTDGDTVWNKQHQPMPNGTGLMGCGNYGSSAQNGLIIPKPGSESLYYIFTNDCQENLAEAGLRYSVVDMSLNAGLGDVTLKNILMLSPSTEALAATKHANGVDYWVMGHEYNTNRYFCYLLNANGVNTEPVISEIGFVIDDLCSIRFSHAGDMLAVAFTVADFNDQLIRFNTEDGELFDLLLLNGIAFGVGSGSAYCVEFSPDDTKLYGMQSGNYVYQYCLSGEYNAEAISATAVTVALHPDNSAFGKFQLASDGKIYIASQFHSAISSIEYPNYYGSACNLEALNISLGGKESTLGLPAFVNSFLHDSTLIPADCDSVISVMESIRHKEISVFPNPAHEKIRIQFNKNEKGSLSAFNSIGQRVYRCDINENSICIDVRTFANGIHFFLFETESGKQYEETIIIQKN